MIAIRGRNGYGNDDKTALMLHGDGTTTTVVDSSPYNHTVTCVGTATQSGTQKKFGPGAFYFDGNSDYLSVADNDCFAFGTQNFTIDMWLWFATLSGNQAFYAQGNSDNNRMLWYFNGAANGSHWLIEGTDVTISQGSTAGWSVETWYHVATVRNGNVWTAYRNGIAIASYTGAATFPNYAQPVLIGARDYLGTPAVFFNGYIDEVRVSRGIARWTHNFTPPNRAY